MAILVTAYLFLYSISYHRQRFPAEVSQKAKNVKKNKSSKFHTGICLSSDKEMVLGL